MRVLISLLAALSTSIAFRAAAEPAPVPAWYVRGITASMLDPSPDVVAQTIILPDAIGALAAVDASQHQMVLDTLVKLAARPNLGVQRSVVPALAAIKLDTPAQRQMVLDTLVKLAASSDINVQRSVAAALAAIKLDEAVQRQIVLETLVRLAAGPGNDVHPFIGESPGSDVQQSVASALAAIKLDATSQLRTVLDVLVKLAATSDYFVQQSALTALAAIAAISPAQRLIVVDTLLKHVDSPDRDEQQSVVAAFAMIRLEDAAQRQTVVNTLVRLAGSTDSGVRAAVAAALAAIKPDDAAQRQIVFDILVKFAATNDSVVQPSAAAALATVRPDDTAQRQTVLDTFIRLAASSGRDVQASVATALGKVEVDDPAQRQTVLDTLVRLAGSTDSDVQASVATTLGKVELDDPAQRRTVLDTLVKLADSTDSDVQEAVGATLAAIASVSPAQRHIVLDILVKLADSPNGYVQRSAIAALVAIKLDDSAQRQIMLDTLVKLSDSFDAFVPEYVAIALASVKLDDSAQRQIALNTLVKLAAKRNSRYSAATALGKIELDDAAQRRTVLDTLIKLAAKPDSQYSVAIALGTIKLDDAAQRETVLDTLVKIAATTNSVTQLAAERALVLYGPLGFPQIVRVLMSLDRDRAEETSRWRALGWAFAGTLPSREPAAILLTFAGRPVAIDPGQRAKNPSDGATILRTFLAAWPLTEPASRLREEIARQTLETVRAACPAVGVPDAGLFERIGLEWVRTRARVASWLGIDDQTRCWRHGDRLVVENMHQALLSDGRLSEYASAVHDHLAVDGAMPVIGESVLGTLSWIVFWIGFLAAFPHSGRVRAFYLFNEKARGALTLWFVPAIMTLLPVLRRRMLLPFRDDLLADARLDMLDEREWFARIYIQDRTRSSRKIAEAIPEVRGRTLLVGESGLGKTIFLRLLAKRSRRTLVFLNARSCEKGVEDAILQRVSSFQSADFFRALIYSGDLVVVIDGLNEVNADIRAGIVAFANRPGKPNLLIATQPIEAFGTERSPLVGVTSFELLPLPRSEIAGFLKSRKVREDANMLVHGEVYDRAVDQMLADALDVPPGDGEDVLQEQAAGLQLLSNPMDLTYASELLAQGKIPRPSQIVEQAYTLARARYRLLQNRDFPVARFAECAVKLRREDRNWLNAEEFPAEQGVLLEYKLLVSRQLKAAAADKDDVTIQRFRHDKVMDVLMKSAFDGNDVLQEELIDDPRFRGVYLLFAQAANLEVGRKLRDLLVSRAAQTGDNALSNEFVRRFDLAARSHKPRRRAA